MELGRWGLKKINRISDRYRDFKDFLADVLEGERSLIVKEINAHGDTISEGPFHTSDEIDSLLYRVGPQRHRALDRSDVIFKGLAPFFEAGFLLRAASSPSELKLESMFLFGKVFVPPASEEPLVEMQLPASPDERVFKGRAAGVLRVFRLEGLTPLREAAAFSFSPKAGLHFVLICNRPHPWQMVAVEKAYTVVQRLLQSQGA